MAETLSTLSIISFVASGVFLALAVFFWFFFRISSRFRKYLFGGKTRKGSLVKRRKAQEASAVHVHVDNAKNVAHSQKETDVLATKPMKAQDVRTDIFATRPMKTQDAKTDIMDTVPMGTMPLSNVAGVTAQLNDSAWQAVKPISGKKLTMLDEVMMIQTDETIETEN